MGKCYECTFYESGGWFSGFGYCNLHKKEVSPDSSCKDFTPAKDVSTCVITTACVKAKGLPDDCVELQAVRFLRDHYIAKLPNGKQIIDNYYNTAPRIIAAIDAIPNEEEKKEVYEKLYNEINYVVKLILEGKEKDAFEYALTIYHKLREQFIK